MSKLTFENYSESNTEFKSLINTQKNSKSTLLDKKQWLTDDFLKDYNKRNSEFTSNQEDLKRDFSNWHKIEGEKLFDRNKNSFKLSSIKRITHYLSVHPLMTSLDNKKIQLIKEEIKSRFLRTLFFNSLVIFPISIGLLFRKLGIKSRRHMNKAIIFRTISFLAIFLLFQDIVFKKNLLYVKLKQTFQR